MGAALFGAAAFGADFGLADARKGVLKIGRLAAGAGLEATGGARGFSLVAAPPPPPPPNKPPKGEEGAFAFFAGLEASGVFAAAFAGAFAGIFVGAFGDAF